jgi:hypothetical protein
VLVKVRGIAKNRESNMTVTKILVPVVVVLAIVLTLQVTGVFEFLPGPQTIATGKIAFRSGNAIYVINADGSDETRLTDDPSYDGHPAWSPR